MTVTDMDLHELLDEDFVDIRSQHPEVYNIFKEKIDEGFLYSSHGQKPINELAEKILSALCKPENKNED